MCCASHPRGIEPPGFRGTSTGPEVVPADSDAPAESDAPSTARPRKHPEELLDRGVRLVFKSGRPIPPAARDLRVSSRCCASASGGPRPHEYRVSGRLARADIAVGRDRGRGLAKARRVPAAQAVTLIAPPAGAAIQSDQPATFTTRLDEGDTSSQVVLVRQRFGVVGL